MNWLARAAREISDTAGKPTVKTAKTAVSSVLTVPHAGVSQRSEDMAADRIPPEGGRTPSADSLTARPTYFRGRPPASPRTGARGSRSRPGPRTRTAAPLAGRHGHRYRFIAPGQGH